MSLRMPLLTVAPNGARRGRADHPAIPLTIPEIAETAAACHAAGAQAIHLHVRDASGAHVLDHALYAQALAAVARATGGRMAVQLTTEAAGRYGPEAIRAFLDTLHDDAHRVSVALREVAPDAGHEGAAAETFARVQARGTAIQHFLHTPPDLARFCDLVRRGVVPDVDLDVLFVLGRYGADETDPRQLGDYLAILDASGLAERVEWAVCAFGRMETRSLAAALAAGGKARVGFENSFLNADGSTARDNAERVSEVAGLARLLGRMPADDQQNS